MLYHVTPVENLETIMQCGVKPGIGERSAMLGETVPRVYLFASLSDCEDALGNWLGEVFEEVPEQGLAILEIEPAGLEVTPGDAAFEHCCSSLITPDRIIRVLGEDFEPLSAPAPAVMRMR